MTDAGLRQPPSLIDRILAWRDATVASAGFQKWAARFPLTRPIARRRSRALFDVMAGFVYSQVLHACVELDLFALLSREPLTVDLIAKRVDLPEDALERLIRAAVALQLLERRSRGRIGLGSLGAPLANNEGLRALVDHHALLYDDLRNPVALLRRHSDTDTALGRYYPYAAEGSAPVAKEVASYSALMSVTAEPLIAEVLDAYSFAPHRRVMDVGGGEGRFARALADRWPQLEVSVFDLPSVAERAALENTRKQSPVKVVGGDFRQDELPAGRDIITLVRILLDHSDTTVLELLKKVRRALAPNGKLLIAEPMAGVRGAGTVGDAYFGFYLFAMGNGRARRQSELESLCLQAGFRRCHALGTRYPVSTGILVAEV
ncbi:MAG: methyltransferase domain-containing protein [Phycisphaerae bacterium]|nr:methyltransferase domain-containing protein [Gemmatimonadaceae bacterium]